MNLNFKHSLGIEVVSKTTGLRGIVTSRSENLYGCNRYYIQPKVDKEMKHVDGWWVDEDDIEIVGSGLTKGEPKSTGGPMSKIV